MGQKFNNRPTLVHSLGLTLVESWVVVSVDPYSLKGH
jgi:hypothetical protein